MLEQAGKRFFVVRVGYGDRNVILKHPVRVDPVKLPEGSAAQLPHSLAEVLDLLEADEALTAAMGPQMTSTYLQYKRSEVAAYAAMDPEQVAAEHRYKF